MPKTKKNRQGKEKSRKSHNSSPGGKKTIASRQKPGRVKKERKIGARSVSHHTKDEPINKSEDILSGSAESDSLMREEIIPAPEDIEKQPRDFGPSGNQGSASLSSNNSGYIVADSDINDLQTSTTGRAETPSKRDFDTSDNELQLVCFNLDNEEYGVNIDCVQEINRIPEIRKVPDTPPYVKGVINLRGQVIPVVELRLLLGLAEEAYNPKTRIVVLDNEDSLLGIVVDNVTQVLRLKSQMFVETPVMVSTPGREFLEGIFQHDDKLILVIDCDSIFKHDIGIPDVESGENT